MEEDHLTPEQLATLREIRARKGAIVKAHRMKKAVANNQAVLPRRADAQRTATTRNMKVRHFCLLSCRFRPGGAAAVRTATTPDILLAVLHQHFLA